MVTSSHDAPGPVPEPQTSDRPPPRDLLLEAMAHALGSGPHEPSEPVDRPARDPRYP